MHGLFRKPITLILLTWKEKSWEKKQQMRDWDRDKDKDTDRDENYHTEIVYTLHTTL